MNNLYKNKKLAIFDLDGTIVDTLFDVTSSINLALKELDLETVDSSFVKSYLGFGGKHLVNAAIKKSQEPTKKLVEEVNDLYMHYYAQEMVKKSCLYSDVIKILEKLINDDFILAMCTNKISKFTLPLLEYLKIKKYFKVIVCGDTYSYKKPSPYPLTQILSFFNLKPDKAIYIGDTDIDRMSAEEANIQFIYASYGYGSLDCHKFSTILNFSDLIANV